MVGNAASCRVLEKAGFRRDGLYRAVTFLHGRYTDMYLYAITRGLDPAALEGSAGIAGAPLRLVEHGGLGAVVTSGLYSNPALAILAGLVIVVMAMALDRSFAAIAERTDPATQHLDASWKRRGLGTLALVATIVVGVVVSKVAGAGAVERLRPLVRAGVGHVSLGPPLGPDPVRAVELLVRHVLPRLA